MNSELTTYLLGLIPSMTVIIGLIPVVIKVFSWVKKIKNQDKDMATQVSALNERLDKVLADNSNLRKELLIQKRENRRLLSKITNVYIPEDKGE